MKIGFSGVGNMASAIINGLLAKDHLSMSLHGYSPSGPKPTNSVHQKIQWHPSNYALAKTVDVFIIATKPYLIPEVMAEIRELSPLPVLVSLAAGTRINTIEQNLNQNQQPAIIRTMPNTPSAVGAGMTGLYANQSVTEHTKIQIDRLFQSIGRTIWLEQEEDFHGLTAISGSGPAYFFQFTDGLIKAGIAQGLSEEAARQLAVQTAYGAGQLLEQSGRHPAQLQKEVTSPNGTTFAATEIFRKEGLHELINTAVTAATQRSIELGGC